MFDNLDEQIANAQTTSSTRSERLIQYLGIVVVSVILFGGLFWGILLLEY